MSSFESLDSRFDFKTNISRISFDVEKGLGNVPNSSNIEYMGFIVMMKPSIFLSLSHPLEYVSSTKINSLKELIISGTSIAPPFFVIEYGEEEKQISEIPRIVSHEGRHRMTIISQIAGDIEVPVHIFPRGLRARHMSKAHLDAFRNEAISQSETHIEGPLFGDCMILGKKIEFEESYKTNNNF